MDIKDRKLKVTIYEPSSSIEIKYGDISLLRWTSIDIYLVENPLVGILDTNKIKYIIDNIDALIEQRGYIENFNDDITMVNIYDDCIEYCNDYNEIMISIDKFNNKENLFFNKLETFDNSVNLENIKLYVQVKEIITKYAIYSFKASDYILDDARKFIIRNSDNIEYDKMCTIRMETNEINKEELKNIEMIDKNTEIFMLKIKRG